eukprot:TRINITY_DN510_c0_g1_i1.p1 TRINITY_DN510_c0_g1~~TRINITY_DN510_c0_g1_i1.p1  ORF type:complete len:1007 (-),score=356.97 TRINITY_DN510_c0_g1_i1:60-2822(-)
MGFPSENVEAAYRNPYKDVFRFLESLHKDHYRVYNLCSERSYDKTKFHNRVVVFPFDDHNAPPFNLIQQFCANVHDWLRADEQNIAVIHCKAGKGRTGLMICSFMLSMKEWEMTDEALAFYAAARTLNKQGVTIPSQLRYVNYFGELVRTGAKHDKSLVLLKKVTLFPKPKLPDNAEIHFKIYVWKTLVYDSSADAEKEKAASSKKGSGKKSSKSPEPEAATPASAAKDKKEKEKALAEIQKFRAAFFNTFLDEMKAKSEELPPTFEFLYAFYNRCKEEESKQWEQAPVTFDIVPNLPLNDDIKLEFFVSKEHFFNVWFNTFFIKDDHAIICKPGLDKGYKDKRLAPNFYVEVSTESLHQQAPKSKSPDSAASATPTEGDAPSADPAPAASVADPELTPELIRIKCAHAIHARFFPDIVLRRTMELTNKSKWSTCGVINDEPKFSGDARGPEEVALSLLDQIVQIYLRCGYAGWCLDANIVGVTYHPDFPEFVEALSELQNLDLNLLKTNEQKIAFWINVYNIMSLHSAAVNHILPSRDPIIVKPREKGTAMMDFRYIIGGHTFTHYEVEHGMLRPELPVPDNGMGGPVSFEANDIRRKWFVDKYDHRIPFAMSFCTTSSPGIWLLKSETLDAQLTLAAKTFVAANLHHIPSLKTVFLPKFIMWYQKDYTSKNGAVDFLEQFLPEGFGASDKKKSSSNSSKKKKSAFHKLDVRFNEHDWELRVLLDHLKVVGVCIDHKLTGPAAAAKRERDERRAAAAQEAAERKKAEKEKAKKERKERKHREKEDKEKSEHEASGEDKDHEKEEKKKNGKKKEKENDKEKEEKAAPVKMAQVRAGDGQRSILFGSARASPSAQQQQQAGPAVAVAAAALPQSPAPAPAPASEVDADAAAAVVEEESTTSSEDDDDDDDDTDSEEEEDAF